MSLLPCDRNLAALGVVSGRYWDLEALGHHVRACQRCAAVYRAMASAMGSQGGRAGRGAAKRRGDSDHYRRLARLSWGVSR